MSNPTAAQLTEISDDERTAAVTWARARSFGQYKGTGVYPVTVGGYVVGQVRRGAGLATAKVGTGPSTWTVKLNGGVYLKDSNGARVMFYKRADAVEALARTDAGVKAYREAAWEGAFGTAVEKTERARRDAIFAALDAESAMDIVTADCDAVHARPADLEAEDAERADQMVAEVVGRASAVSTEEERLAKRRDEAWFYLALARVGAMVGDLKPIKVGRFVPGGNGAYASAYVICHRQGMPEERAYSTNMLVLHDDPVGWSACAGDYDMSWDEAKKSLAER